MGAFHAYDIRGIYNEDFDKETAYKIGYFLPSLLKTGQVLVGRDCRLSSEEIHDSLIEGITDAGADAVDIGLSSTPMVYFATANYGFKASVQITASHNPSNYNGMKVSRENALPVGFDNGLGQIQQWILEGRPTTPAEHKGKVIKKDILDDYLSFMTAYKTDLSGLNIAFDLCNGMSCLFAKRVYGERPSYVNDRMDGSFPGHEPNPLLPENREQLRRLVLENKADIGVIYDGDADRVMFLDEKGNFVAPDLLVAFLSRYFISERGAVAPRVLQEIRSSKAVAEYLEPMGCELRTWRVGRAFAAPRLRDIDGLWGGELAGHYYFKDFFYSDSGLLASLIILHIVDVLKKQGVGFSEAMAELAAYRNSGEINFKLEDKQGAMNAVRDYFMKEEKSTAYMDFDGYRVEFEKWWFNIRPSNTEPYLRFICEAVSDELLAEKVEMASKIIQTKFGGKRV